MFPGIDDEVFKEVWKPRDPSMPPEVKSGIYKPTFVELCEIEPALREMQTRINREPRDRKSYCANHVWHTYFLPLLCVLVGWTSRHPNPVMRCTEAYNVAYDTLYKQLPDCRRCRCIAIEKAVRLR